MKKSALFTFIFFGACFLYIHTMQAADIVYIPDHTTIFSNPERGFTEECNRVVTTSKPNVLKGNISDNWGQKDHMTLLVLLYDFKQFKAVDLPDEILSGFDEDMQILRDNGWKCVLRFAYTERESDKVDATPEWVERHLQQLKPHLAAAADVIYVLEAGFVGVWGEWYYSTNYGNETQHLNANRRRVIEALFANAPEDRFILFRYPMIKTEYLGHDTPLSAEEGFSGTIRARMGCHNDAFLHDWGNMGTYASDDKSDDPAVRQYIATETLYVPNGGETNIDDDDALAEKRYVEAPAEMSKYHWSFCGSTYAMPVIRRWRNSGLFDTLNVHMGYRYSLLSGSYSDQAAPAGKANITIRLQNTGYAPIYNERTAYLVLRNEKQTISIPLNTDPRRWLPNNVVSLINEQVSIPADMPEGTYHLYLHLPDKYASLAADPRFAVRMANQNIWDSATGMNDLGASIIISNSADPDPGPLPDDVPEIREEDTAQKNAKKIVQEGILYVQMPDGRKISALGQLY